MSATTGGLATTPLDVHGATDDAIGLAPPANWLAAYAMGVVASNRQADGVIELTEFVRSDPQPLRAARSHLADGAVGDEVLRAGARRLLDEAVALAAGAERAGRTRVDA